MPMVKRNLSMLIPPPVDTIQLDVAADLVRFPPPVDTIQLDVSLDHVSNPDGA